MLSHVSSLEYEKSEIMKRLRDLKAGHAKKVTAEERDKVEHGWKAMKAICARREKIVKDFWRTVEDGTEGKEALEEMREEWGLDD